MSILFSITHEEGCEPTPTQLVEALERRIANLKLDEIEEACELVYEYESIDPVTDESTSHV